LHCRSYHRLTADAVLACAMTLPRHSPAPLPVLCAVSFCHLAAAAPTGGGWQQLLTDKVIACGAIAVALLVLSLLLRGLLKLLTLALFVVLAAGAFWFLREAWLHRAELLPHEWNAMADETLDNPKARAAWQSVQDELSSLSADTRERLVAGTDDARRTVLEKLDTRARNLRKEGSKAEAAKLDRLAALIREQK